jgi:hypothetical protein
MSNCYGYDEVIELVFTDHHLVKDIQAFIDGKSCPVYRYTYPVSSAMWTWYIELTGAVKSGTKPELEIYIEWNDDQPVAAVQKNEQKVFVIGQN